jgi:hypothetical protein
MAKQSQNIEKEPTAKQVCDGLMETPSCNFVALFRNNKRVIGYKEKDHQFSRSPAGTHLYRIQLELENTNTPPNIYEIRYTSSLNNSDGYQSIFFNKKIGRIYSINDSIDKVNLPKSEEYQNKTANDVLIEIAELRITNQFQQNEIDRLQELVNELQDVNSQLEANNEYLENEIQEFSANQDLAEAEPKQSFLEKVLADPEMINPILEKASPIIAFLADRFMPKPKERNTTPSNGQAHSNFKPLVYEAGSGN